MGRLTLQQIKVALANECRALVKIQPSDRPWQLPFAAAISSGGPMAAGAASGHPAAGALGAVAGLSFLYLPATPLRQRIPLIIGCSFVMWASFATGLIAGGRPVAAILVTSGVAVAATWFCKVWRLMPPGPLFMVMAAAIAAFLPAMEGGLTRILGSFALGCLWACAVAVAYSLYIVRLRQPQPASRPGPAELRAAAGDSVLTGTFVALSLVLAAVLGFDRPYWVPVSCLAVMQGLTLRAAWNRNVHRMVGTAIGLGLTALIMPLMISASFVAVAVIGLTYLIETAVVRHYAFAAIFITPLTIILAENSSQGQASVAALMNARLVDTVVGALIGLAGAICLHHPAFRRPLDWLVSRGR